MRKMNAFIDQYKREKKFADSLEEFDDSENAVLDLIDQYKGAEKSDFIDWNLDDLDDQEIED